MDYKLWRLLLRLHEYKLFVWRIILAVKRIFFRPRKGEKKYFVQAQGSKIKKGDFVVFTPGRRIVYDAWWDVELRVGRAAEDSFCKLDEEKLILVETWKGKVI